MNLGDLEFKPGDWSLGGGTADAGMITEIANRLLAERLEKAQVIRLERITKHSTWRQICLHSVIRQFDELGNPNDFATARLVCIEEIGK